MKEIDIEGEATLKAISRANRFNYWMYQQIEPYIKGDVLEIGSGIGNISAFIRTDGAVTLSDVSARYRDLLLEHYPDRQVIELDLVHPDFNSTYEHLLASFDVVFALNVVEHVEDDHRALLNMSALLKKGGVMVVLVPACQALYNRFDESLGHYRRYTLQTLQSAMTAQLQVVQSHYFNAMGIAPWFIFGRLLGQTVIGETNMVLYNAITPLAKWIDAVLLRKIGLSAIVACRKSVQCDV